MAAPLDGPRLSPKSGRVKQLVVFLHGYGADGADLIEIGRQWQVFLPDAAFVAPNAPERVPMQPTGRQWFPLTRRDPEERWNGVNQACPALDAFLTNEMQTHGLNESSMALVGFSQGAMMALHCGLRLKLAPACILGFSGMLAGPEHLGEATARDKNGAPPPILLAHGAADDVIPVDALFAAVEALAEAGLPCQWHLALDLGHGIDEGGLAQGGLFLAQNFGIKIDGKAPPPPMPRRR